MRRTATNWGIALGCALAMHAGVAAAILLPSPDPEPTDDGVGGFEIALGVGGLVGASELTDATPVEPAEAAPAEIIEQASEVEPTPELAEAIETPSVEDVTVDDVEVVEHEPEIEEPAEPVVAETIEPEETETVEEIERPKPVVVAKVTPPPPKPPQEVKVERKPTPKPPVEVKAPPQPVAVAAAEPSERPAQPAAPSRSAPTSNTASNMAPAAGGHPIGSATASADGTADYISILRSWLERHKEYPRRARLRGQEGTVLLYLMIDEEGNVLDHRIEQSAGFALLDDAVHDLVARAQPLPAAPDSFDRERLELVVPIRFFLR